MTTGYTCEHYFDGETMHGLTRVYRSAPGGPYVSEPYSGPGIPDFYLLTPGLTDLQVNGYGAIDVATASVEELYALDAELHDLGVTAWLATIITADLTAMRASMDTVDEAVRSGRAPGLRGIHLEGPFLGRAPGAHPENKIIPVDLAWLAALPDSVRLVTLAPEQAGAVEAIKLLTARGIRVSLGHSQPTAAEYERAVRAGATMVTHLFNGMSGISHRAEPGLALLALVDPRVTVGLIADSTHVNAPAVQLAFKTSAVYLVSDSMAWDSPAALRQGLTRGVDRAVRLADGRLTGSGMALSECVRTAAVECGIDLPAVLRAATGIPAQLMGWPVPMSLVAWDKGLKVKIKY